VIALAVNCLNHGVELICRDSCCVCLFGQFAAVNLIDHNINYMPVWPCCTPGPWTTSTWCSASVGGYIRRQKANGQLEKTARPPSQRLAEQTSGGCQRSTLSTLWRSEIAMGHSRSGATVHSDYATTTTTMMMILT